MSPVLRAKSAIPVNKIVTEINELMVARCMSMERLSEISGYGKSEISMWFCGRRRMPLSAAIDLAQSLGKDLKIVDSEPDE